jgi:hypothetical protein
MGSRERWDCQSSFRSRRRRRSCRRRCVTRCSTSGAGRRVQHDGAGTRRCPRGGLCLLRHYLRRDARGRRQRALLRRRGPDRRVHAHPGSQGQAAGLQREHEPVPERLLRVVAAATPRAPRAASWRSSARPRASWARPATLPASRHRIRRAAERLAAAAALILAKASGRLRPEARARIRAREEAAAQQPRWTTIPCQRNHSTHRCQTSRTRRRGPRTARRVEAPEATRRLPRHALPLQLWRRRRQRRPGWRRATR